MSLAIWFLVDTVEQSVARRLNRHILASNLSITVLEQLLYLCETASDEYLTMALNEALGVD